MIGNTLNPAVFLQWRGHGFHAAVRAVAGALLIFLVLSFRGDTGVAQTQSYSRPLVYCAPAGGDGISRKSTGGTALMVYDPKHPEAAYTLHTAPQGDIRDPALDHDGTTVVFSMRTSPEDTHHVYTIGLDGTGFRQLTSMDAVDDTEPAFIPGGGIVFTSTRTGIFSTADGDYVRHLYRMDGDGANIRRLGDGPVAETSPRIAVDGRIQFMRTVNPGDGVRCEIWSMYPDGTGRALYWRPPAGVELVDWTPLPDSREIAAWLAFDDGTDNVAACLIDRRYGLDTPASIRRTLHDTHVSAIKSAGHGCEDADNTAGGRFTAAGGYLFHVVPAQDGAAARLVAVGGDREPSTTLLPFVPAGLCPVAPVDRPPAIPPRIQYASETARFYILDVHSGGGMDGVVRNEVRSIRIIGPGAGDGTAGKETFPATFGSAAGVASDIIRREIGTVPVADDGSVYCEVPAGIPFSLQALDANGRMVQTMDTDILLQPGEIHGCIGCHESRLTSPPVPGSTMPDAVQQAPVVPDAPDPRTASPSFARDIQPLLNDRCLSCHDYGGSASGTLLLASDRTLLFNAAYEELADGGYLGLPRAANGDIPEPRSRGSNASRLVAVLDGGHQDIEVTDDEMDLICRWLDLGAPYYATGISARPDRFGGRSPLKVAEMRELESLTGESLVQPRTPALANFDRPELSRCLHMLREGSDEYARAIALIGSGAERLRRRPRADMAGFRMPETAVLRESVRRSRLRIESLVLSALADGRKIFDDGSMLAPEEE